MGLLNGHTASRFRTTSWTLVYDARAGGDDLAALLTQYWGPVYAFLRREGRDPEAAEELTQAFLADVVLERRLLDRADQTRGRFRSFLLKSLRHFVIDVHRHDHGRDGQRRFTFLPDDPDQIRLAEPRGSDDPAQAYTRQWATTVFSQALQRMREACAADDMDAHWTIFEARTVRPLLHGGAPATVADLVTMTGASGPEQVSNQLRSAKRKFYGVLHEIVAATVDDPAEIDAEIDELMAALMTG